MPRRGGPQDGRTGVRGGRAGVRGRTVCGGCRWGPRGTTWTGIFTAPLVDLRGRNLATTNTRSASRTYLRLPPRLTDTIGDQGLSPNPPRPTDQQPPAGGAAPRPFNTRETAAPVCNRYSTDPPDGSPLRPTADGRPSADEERRAGPPEAEPTGWSPIGAPRDLDGSEGRPGGHWRGCSTPDGSGTSQGTTRGGHLGRQEVEEGQSS